MWITRTLALSLLLAASVSCGDDGGSGGYASSGPSGGGGLIGTWQGTGSRLGGPSQEVTVTMGPDLFSVSAPGGSVLAQRTGSTFAITYTRGSLAHQAVAQQAAAGEGALGDFPFDLSGSWKVTNPSGDELHGCSTLLSGESASASCASVSGLPRFLPNLSKGTASATRGQALPSIFGQLGGEWMVALSGGGSCTVRFEGSSFSSTCSGAGPFTGTMQVSFDGNLISGSTSEGYEFSAQRK